MVDYVQKLRDDLVEQFKGKPVIDALMEAVGDELNEVRQFYEDLRDKRNIQTAVGNASESKKPAGEKRVPDTWNRA